MPATTYGTLAYQPPELGRRIGHWEVTPAPHVAIRIKRIFPRVQSTRTGTIIIADNPEVARDLEWLCGRWPLDMDAGTAAALEAGAKVHRDNEQAVHAILSGHRTDTAGLREAAQATRDYQQTVVDLISVTKRLLVTDALGLGKTHEGLLAFRNPDSLPALVVTLTHLPPQWEEQVRTIWPDLKVHVARKGSPYDFARFGGEPDVLIMNYAKIAGWRHHLSGQVRTVIFDEVQELRRGSQAVKGLAAAHLSANATYSIGLTATPIYNYGGELHAIIDILSPGALGSREEFLREWGGASWMSSSGDQHATVADPKALSVYLRDSGLMVGRTRAEVGRSLPYGDPVKVPHVVEADTAVLDKMSGNAVEMARMILAQTTDATTRWRTSGELDLRMRQATGIAKAPFVANFVAALLQSQQRVVLWGWHHACYQIWRERLDQFRPVFYTGNESPRQKRSAFDEFTRGRSRVLVMSLRAGAGLDGLQDYCSVGVFGELDWSPKVHDQALGRLARDGQENEVVGYYLMANHGADPKIAEVLNLKRQQAAPIEDPSADACAALPDSRRRVRELAADLLRQHGIDPEHATAG